MTALLSDDFTPPKNFGHAHASDTNGFKFNTGMALVFLNLVTPKRQTYLKTVRILI